MGRDEVGTRRTLTVCRIIVDPLITSYALLNGGHHVVGGPPQVRELAWEWVRMKKASKPRLGSRQWG
jgi:hypothetical protein